MLGLQVASEVCSLGLMVRFRALPNESATKLDSVTAHTDHPAQPQFIGDR